MIVECKNCRKEFDKRPDQVRRSPNHFCSRSCSAKYNNIGRRRWGKPPSSCKYCGKKTSRASNEYCSVSCKHAYEHELYIKRWKEGKETGAKSNGFVISGHIRRYLFEKYEGKCSRCGWNKMNPFINKVILEVEHIDGDCTNNKEENLDLICPNCHSLTATYRALNSGKGNRDRLLYYKLSGPQALR